MIGIALVLALAAAPDAQTYDRLLVDLQALEERGRYVTAARRAEARLPDFPQDYGLVLYAAWLRFEAGHYARARRHYVRAIELSGGSVESRLGLAWSHLEDGQRRRALEQLEHLARRQPQSPAVADALATARDHPVVEVTPTATAIAHVYDHHPTLTRGFGALATVGTRIAAHGLVGVGYGFTQLGYHAAATTTASDSVPRGSGAGAMNGPGGMGGGGGGTGGGGTMNQFGVRAAEDVGGGTVEQHQLHAWAGPTWTTAGALVQYGLLRDEGFADAHAIGTSIRYSPWGDIVLDANVVVQGGVAIPRVSPSWRLPVHRHLWVTPATSVQIADGEALVSGAATIGVTGHPGTIWAGGKYGRERRPAYLSVPTIYNLTGDLRGGGWLGGWVRLPAGFGLTIGYEAYVLDAALTGDTTTRAYAHYIGLGLTWAHA